MKKGRLIDLKARRGMDFVDWLESVLAMFRREGSLTISGNVRVHQTLTGKHIIAESESVDFKGAFTVSLVAENTIQVNGGGVVVVNGLLREPVIGDRFISGVDETGARDADGVPTLVLNPVSGARSLIWLRVGGGDEGGEPEVEIVQERPAGSSGANDDSGFKALAVILWKDGKATGVRPITYFNQRAELRDEKWVILAES
jgi:hypothetical protein